MRIALRLVALPFFAATLSTATVAEAAGFSCRETPIVHSNIALGSIGQRVAQGQPLAILAIGSSTTEGIGASEKARTYPARLQALLGKAWPKTKIEMVNAGIGGETAPQTLARLKTALAERSYDLVIWQVGTNDAVTGGDIEAFRAMVADGIGMVKRAGSALAILDQQFYPSIKDPQRYAAYVAAVGEVARREAVPVFGRYQAMTEWYRSDAEAFKSVLWQDGFHMSDAGYDCLARNMALSLTEMTGPARPVVAQSR